MEIDYSSLQHESNQNGDSFTFRRHQSHQCTQPMHSPNVNQAVLNSLFRSQLPFIAQKGGPFLVLSSIGPTATRYEQEVFSKLLFSSGS